MRIIEVGKDKALEGISTTKRIFNNIEKFVITLSIVGSEGVLLRNISKLELSDTWYKLTLLMITIAGSFAVWHLLKQFDFERK